MEISIQFFILRGFSGYEKVYRAVQVLSRQGNAIIDKILSRH
jgi:hypothetical protein